MKRGIILLACFFSLTAHAQEFNAGFVQGLWYSEESFFVDDTVRIYVAIRNNTGSDLTGTVEFFDNDKKIGRSTVSALDGRIIESWTDWKPSYGEHTISASLTRIELHTIGEQTEAIEVRSSVAEDIIFVDHDTDGDGVGNENDVDDDGDGISDVVEIKNGTNPLAPESPEETEEVADDASSSTSTTSTTVNRSTQNTEGLEQFLTPSRADTMLSAITEFAQEKKAALDTYRTTRSLTPEEIQAQKEANIEVDSDGFGEITRTTSEASDNDGRKRDREKPEGFIGDVISFIGAIFNGIYSGILAIISWTLGHPILLQLLLLFGILYTLYRIAKRLGGRPQ